MSNKITPILLFIAFVILIILGSWQLKRRNEKIAFINSIEHNITAPAALLTGDDGIKHPHSKIRLQGMFINEKSTYLYGRKTSSSEKDGYYLLTPFKDISGNIYLISRGWLPHSAKDNLHLPNLPNNQVEITAITLPGEHKNFMVPDNDLENNIWFTIDLGMAKKIFNITNDKYYLMEVNSEHLPLGVLPHSMTNLSKIRNDHLEYALTWFGLALCLLIMCIYNARITRKSKIKSL